MKLESPWIICLVILIKVESRFQCLCLSVFQWEQAVAHLTADRSPALIELAENMNKNSDPNIRQILSDLWIARKSDDSSDSVFVTLLQRDAFTGLKVQLLN